MKNIIFILFCFATNHIVSQEIYFPPLNSNLPWDTISPESLGWCVDQTDELYDFLEQGNAKGFIVLKDGKRVLEKYFGTFTQDSLWYWASAGKTITSFLVGKAQEEQYLSIDEPTSNYLGGGWTNCTPEQEQNITLWNQLTMTTGLDDGVPDDNCTIDTCLNYLQDTGERWAYHNAPYTLLEDVITDATGQGINLYTNQKLKVKTGMTGIWLTLDYNNIYYSDLRSMARFGLLAQNNFIWDEDTLLYDTAYVNQMTNTSQEINLSYGYLWWLNGKPSFMAPGLQIPIPIELAPVAPDDMFAALGKNGQILSVARSSGIVFARMGDPPGDNGAVPITYTNDIWEKLNTIMCGVISVEEDVVQKLKLYPNPSSNEINLQITCTAKAVIQIINVLGEVVIDEIFSSRVDVSSLSTGIYIVRVNEGGRIFQEKFLKE